MELQSLLEFLPINSIFNGIPKRDFNHPTFMDHSLNQV